MQTIHFEHYSPFISCLKIHESYLVMLQNSTVILSESSQSGGNIGPNLSSNSNKCFLNHTYRRLILSSQAVSCVSWNRWQYSASWSPMNHFNKSRLKEYIIHNYIRQKGRIISSLHSTYYWNQKIFVCENTCQWEHFYEGKRDGVNYIKINITKHFKSGRLYG